MPWIILGTFISYLIGSIPTAFILGRCLKGVDIRKFGSGNIGATNALRVLGKGPGIAVLLLDVLKGFVAVVFLGNIVVHKFTLAPQETSLIILGLSCISGHNWTIFLGFKGGKGVATTFGVLIGLATKIAGLGAVLGLAILTWLAAFLIVRIVSVASVITGISLPVFMILLKQSSILVFFSIVLSVFIIFRHKPNIKRFFRGEERRLF